MIMLNSLDAIKGQDFSTLSNHDIKSKLPPSLMAFWEVTENNNMDIITADGHPLGMTFKFKIDVSQNPNYKQFIKLLTTEPLYSDYLLSYSEIEPGKIIFISFELTNLQNRL